jgi:MraZ protein
MDVTGRIMVRSVPSLQTQKIASTKAQTAPGAKTVALPAVPVMIGTHFHALDEKGRVIIPSKLRPALTEQFWMMRDESDNIAIYTHQTGLDVFEHCERLMAEHPDDEAIAKAVERLTGAADLVTVEPSNWRVPISEMLRYHAELDKDVVTVGVLNHAVLWDRKRWEKAQERKPEESAVRKAQAGILRAAASGVRVRNERTERQSEDAREIASAGDGGGSSERSRLSQLGR